MALKTLFKFFSFRKKKKRKVTKTFKAEICFVVSCYNEFLI